MPYIPTTSAQSLTVSTLVVTLTVPGQATRAQIQVQTNDIRFYTDGTAPTATAGWHAGPLDTIILSGQAEMTNFKVIREDAADATIVILYYTGRIQEVDQAN